MKKYSLSKVLVFFFLTISVFASVYLVEKTQILQKFASEKEASATLSIFPGKQLNRYWSNFSQGGESHEPMLKPAEKQIRLLQPEYIRIDHLFDFPNLDGRIEEITSLGAKPFLSLSYFPPSVSSSLIVLPENFDEWSRLVSATVQKTSGRNERNLLDVYYEVWNEPDLFGSMTPEQYFSLYQATVIAAANCQNCNDFKIGGPAITTLKKDWMEKFLSLVGQSNLRMDFVSWHSYQLNPDKTLWEAQALRGLKSFQQYFPRKELIISEWGSIPEVSPLHDSYFDAGHTVSAIDKLKNSVDKVFTFELVDGPDPEGKKYWGRWGLLTNQAFDLTPKPNYYVYLYLSKMLNFEMKNREVSSNLSALGSTDGKESYSVLFSRTKGSSSSIPANLSLIDALPGTYNVNSYILDPNHNPLLLENETITVNNGLSLTKQMLANSVVLIEISRISPALILGRGMTEMPNDSSAKISSSLQPLVFFLKEPEKINKLEIDFWFKANFDNLISENRIIFENAKDGNGVTAWFEETDAKTEIHIGAFNGTMILEQAKLGFLPDREIWHHFTLSADIIQKTVGIKIDDQQITIPLPENIKFGELLFLGSSGNKTNFAEGFIDNVIIKTDNQATYQKDFN